MLSIVYENIARDIKSQDPDRKFPTDSIPCPEGICYASGMNGAYFSGFGLGAGLIIAIGAQNAFVLSQGVRRRFFILIPAICALCDVLLISAGVAGMGGIFSRSLLLRRLAAGGGALFLLWYGFRSFRSVFRSENLEIENAGPATAGKAVLMTLGVTLLNPHVYLDTVVLLGSISSRYSSTGRWIFAAGAASASLIWFFTLSLGGRLLSPLFRRPLAWKILDGLVGCIMWILAASLIRQVLAAG